MDQLRRPSVPLAAPAVSVVVIVFNDSDRLPTAVRSVLGQTLRSVEANTRRDGEKLLREAAEIPIRPAVVPYPLDAANDALAALKADRLVGTGVLLT